MTLWTVAHRAPLSTEFQARILEWVFPPPGDISDAGIGPRFPELQIDSLLSEPPGKRARALSLSLYAQPYFTYINILPTLRIIIIPT